MKRLIVLCLLLVLFAALTVVVHARTVVDADEHCHEDSSNYYSDDNELDDENPVSYKGWLICAGIGIAVGFISVFVMKAQLKSVHFQHAAGNYIVDGSFELNKSHDFFLYRTVTRTEIPRNNNK